MNEGEMNEGEMNEGEMNEGEMNEAGNNGFGELFARRERGVPRWIRRPLIRLPRA